MKVSGPRDGAVHGRGGKRPEWGGGINDIICLR